jgi:GH25 family lysozyme M1 (1,4-beta-N-acetylmuramidase)
MIDLSNNNGTVNFRTVRAHGQRRVYLKRSEGTSFIDHTFDARHRDAIAAHMKVGAYHFARPSQNTPREEADFFCRLMPRLERAHSLRPCLDLEDPGVKPSPKIGKWAVEWLHLVRDSLHYLPIIYGGAYYMEPCQFERVPCGLWIAAYGRNDGREYPFHTPAPWNKNRITRRHVLAHQFASTAHVPGCAEPVDISRVYRPRLIDVNRLSFARHHG